MSNAVRHCFTLGIFAYLNYLTPRAREEILTILLNGLKRLEYRGYDSAGHCYSFCEYYLDVINTVCF